ncbi:SGNH/GDSL hydrolase family protein [Saccharopolyspora sp. HNM0983]|uniref:SGNH/GDSL hydrolase family protein n=1 Tax=Saccharopolyspora montiporae TaxID=2781240 RepID=A0A929BE93_9PSEU|nr:SGNH/GDSL hydrolase family protein [Saccharopolyspora sp. HNM0983]MBE9375897.1 SGNH/GDSL hydrolase family protein [Saccharopolyspora sp. HNM0983]
MRRRRPLSAMVALTALALSGTVFAAPGSAAPPAQQVSDDYVALGDSYSSGVGTREYFDDSGDCRRGPHAYPQLYADAAGVTEFAFVACSGAVTDDVDAEQLDALDESTTLVTVSIGGNDVGFADVIQSCLLGDDAGCDEAVSTAEQEMRSELPDKLDDTYDGISGAAPAAEVVVLGYPKLAELGDCGVPGFSETKRERINAGADVLAGVLRERAEAAGFTFADPRSQFDGHGVCGEDEWVNGPSAPLVESFHPNIDGHAAGYLRVLEDALA